MAKISIIVPVYNAGNKLNRCIESILNQTYSEFELILVNDGSTDNSLHICRSYEIKDKRIRVIDKYNEGSILTRKRGIEESTSDYIMFIDADDWVDHNIVRELYDEINNEKCDIVVCDYFKVIGDRAIVKSVNKSEYFRKDTLYDKEEIRTKLVKAYLHGNPFPAGLVCKLYKRDLIVDSGKYLDRIKFLGDDLFYNIEVFLKAKKVKIISKQLYYYRIGGFTSRYMPYHFEDIVNGYKIQKEVIDDYYQDTKQERYNAISMMLMNSFKTSLMNLRLGNFNSIIRKEYISTYIEDQSIKECLINSRVINEIDEKFLSAIQNKDIEYLDNIGKILYRKVKIRKLIMNIISKLNIV